MNNGYLSVSDHILPNLGRDVADDIQRIIDNNPNRTIFFPDGEYLISHPICTPADPKKSVDLQLSNYAVIRAMAGWDHEEAMVRLGAIHPANDIRTPGSNYSLTGGIIDGILSGAIETAPTKTIPYFNFEVPTELTGVDTGILDPRDTYADPAQWEKKAKDLAGRFIKNFHKYENNEKGKALVAAGPKL